MRRNRSKEHQFALRSSLRDEYKLRDGIRRIDKAEQLLYDAPDDHFSDSLYYSQRRLHRPRGARVSLGIECEMIEADRAGRPEQSRDQQYALRWFHFLLIAFATVCVWGQALSFQFVWDDRQFIVQNTAIRSGSMIPAILTRRDAQSSLPEHFALYRPVRTLAYTLLNLADGNPEPRPQIFHAANIIGHGLAAVLLALIANAILFRFGGIDGRLARSASLLMALWFAVHPVTSEVVCWAKSLDDILAAIFCLSAMGQLLAWKEGDRRHLIYSTIFFALAVYSKESAVPFALIATAYFWILLRQPFIQSLRLSGGLLAVALVFVVHRHLVLGQSSQTAPISGSYVQTLVDTIPCAVSYVRLAFGIPPFNIDYAFLTHGRPIFSGPVLAGLLILLSCVGITFFTARSDRWRVCAFGMLWAGLFMLPVSNAVPMMQFMADRFLYLPLIGLLFVIAILLMRVARSRIALAAGCVVVIAWSIVAWERSWIWRDDLTLFVQTALNGPRNTVMENDAVASILELPSVRKVVAPRKGSSLADSDLQNAIHVLSVSRAAFPRQAALANALGACFSKRRQMEEAVHSFSDAVNLAPQKVSYGHNLCRALLESRRVAEAIQVIESLRKLNPDDLGLIRLQCEILIVNNQRDDALRLIEELKHRDPTPGRFDDLLEKAAHGEGGGDKQGASKNENQ